MTKVHGISEVNAMRRTLQPLLAVAGLSLLLASCAGESPTSPKPPTDGGNGGGSCAVTVALDATSVTPMAGTAIIVRASVRKGGAAVPDGTSVVFTTDFGYFLETGLASVSKVTQNGFADVTLGSASSGLSKVKATFECGSAEKSIQYQPVPTNGPFISSIDPTSGTCAGGGTVAIIGGRFGTNPAAVQVLFGGQPASVQTVSDARIVVLTPARTLANSQVPEVVDITVKFFSGDIPTATVVAAKAFTYYCVDPNRRMTLTAIAPNSGSPDGGQQVVITGTNLLPSPASSVATTRVAFGGASASVVSVSSTEITVLTPRRILANPAVSETVDVSVTVDLGLVSQQTGLLSQAYTYRSAGSGGQCVGAPGLFVATLQPESPSNAGSPDGGDIVLISGGGFTAGGSSTAVERTQVFFGGIQGVTLEVNASRIRVSTPRRVLTSPDKPETVNVKVVVDAGGPAEACVESAGAYTYFPGGFLDPVITSMSPSTGPNDASTRVTLFGRNFALPMQVFVGDFEAAVVEIRASQIIFLTPQATGPNSSLAGKTVDVAVRNPYTGKDTVSPVQFRYYACPSINTVVPLIAPWNKSTVVTIAGQAFEEPVEVVYEAGPLTIRPSVTSVSSSLITVVMPPIDPGLGAAGACSDVVGAFRVRFPSIACAELAGATNAFTYSVNPMTAVSASPTQLNQAGGPFGSPITGAPATITVSGTNFVDPMTIVLTKDGSPVANTTVNNAAVANASQLTFTAPAVADSDLNSQACFPAGGTTANGKRFVPTSFGIRLTNARTGCTVDLPNGLVYNPAVTTCSSSISVTGTVPATATLCTPYTGATLNVVGGIPPYVFTAANLPPGLIATPSATGVTISGTPTLPTAGPGQASTPYAGSLTVRDSAVPPAETTVPLSITVTDPVAPLAVTAPAPSTIPRTGGSTGAFLATPSPMPTGFGAVAWTVVQVVPSPAPGTVAFSPATGQISALEVSATVPAGTYTVTLSATDTPVCGGPKHTVQLTYTFTKDGSGTAIDVSGTVPATGILCTPYAGATFTVSGGVLPYTFTAANLPPGLSLSPTTPTSTSVSIVGTPVLPAAGPGQTSTPYSGTLTVSDASAVTADTTVPVSITITDPVAPLAVTPPAPATIPTTGGISGAFSATPSPMPVGFGPVNWEVVAVVPSPAPGTVVFNPVTGQVSVLQVSATVPAATYAVTVRATDTPACSGPRHTVQFNYEFTKTGSDILVAGSAPATATLCTPYPASTFTATGGSGAFTFSVTGLPPGLVATPTPAVNPTSVVISGTPILPAPSPGVATTPYTATLTVSDTSPTTADATVQIPITVTDPLATIAPLGFSLPPSAVIPQGGGNTEAFAATPSPLPAAFGAYSWSVVEVVPLPGVALSIDPVVGGPLAYLDVPAAVPAGTYTVTVRLTDTPVCGGPSHTIQQNYTFIKGGSGSALDVTGTAPGTATLCTPYAGATFTVSGGVLPYTFTAANLPPGLSLSPTTPASTSVSIVGTPVLPAAGPGQPSTPYSGTLTVSDSSAVTADTTVPVSITVTDPVAPLAVTPPAPATIPPTGGISAAFSATPSPMPVGFGPVNWAVVAVVPSPAPGTVVFNPLTGQVSVLEVSGTVPAGTYTVTVRATDTPACGGPSHTVQFNYTFTKSASDDTIVVTGTAPATATLCTPYPASTFTATGGIGTYTFNVTGLPPGLVATPTPAVNPTSVVISGTPILPAPGPGVASTSYTATITVSDTSPATVDVTVLVPISVIDPVATITPLNFSLPPVATIPVEGGLTGTFEATPSPLPPGFGPYSWSVVEVVPGVGLPPGSVTIDPVPGGPLAALSVDASVPAGTYRVTVRLADTPTCGSPTHVIQQNYTFTKTQPDIVVTGAAPATAILCTPYAGATFNVAGGTPPYTFTVANLPPGLIATPGATSLTISGTPTLPAAGPGQASTSYSGTLIVSDSSATTPDTTVAVSITVTDPVAPLAVTPPAQATIPAIGGITASFAATPNPVPVGFGPVNWEVVAVVPSPAPGTVVFNPLTGQVSVLEVSGTVPEGTYTVTVRATDTPACGGPSHTVQFNYQFIKAATACPSVTPGSVVPSSAPWYQATTVTIAGQDFPSTVAEVEVSFVYGARVLRPTVASVTPTLITLVMPVIDPISEFPGNPCANVAGILNVSFPSSTCPAIQGDFTYNVNPMTLVTASPRNLNQAGGLFGDPIGGPPTTITVGGTNFVDPMTIVLTVSDPEIQQPPLEVRYTETANGSISGGGTVLTFTAPAILTDDLWLTPCVPPGGTSPTGTKRVATPFGIRLKNSRTGCVVDLPDILVYNPADTTCYPPPLSITTDALAAATLCQNYIGTTAAAAGGTPPYSWSAAGLPPGMSINPATGVITGTPTLVAAGAGGTTILPVTLFVTDAIPTTVNRTVDMHLIDPNGPFAVPTPAFETIAVGANVNIATFNATPTTPPAFTPVNWTVTGILGGVNLVGSGQSFTLISDGTLPVGVYPIQVTATDTPSCGGAAHTISVNYTFTVQ